MLDKGDRTGVVRWVILFCEPLIAWRGRRPSRDVPRTRTASLRDPAQGSSTCFCLQHAGRRAARSEAENAFAAANGGDWKVYSWNPQTGTPSDLYGSGAAVASPFTTAEDVVAAARSVIQANRAVFKADSERAALCLRSARCGQVGGPLPADLPRDRRLGRRCAPDLHRPGSTLRRGLRFLPGHQARSDTRDPRDRGQDIADALSPFNEPPTAFVSSRHSSSFRCRVSETQVDYRLVWQVKVRTAEPLGIWVTLVDAHSGEIVWRYNDVDFVELRRHDPGADRAAFLLRGADGRSRFPTCGSTCPGVGHGLCRRERQLDAGLRRHRRAARSPPISTAPTST